MTRRPRLHVVLLAGGSGTRFWPMSRAMRPKQFLSLAGKRSLLRDTWARARKLAPASRIWVVAPSGLVAGVRERIPELAPGHLIAEPSPKDTAPAIALACAVIARRDPRATVAIFPCDHVIRDVPAWVRAVGVAARAAEKGALVCLGIVPDRPATGFGYLELTKRAAPGAAVSVKRFVEKPHAARARRFVSSGRYLWNGGMFVWRVADGMSELARVAPEVHAAARAVAAGARDAWSRSPKISIDYALMEKAAHVRVVPLHAGWDDLGSWDAAARHSSASGEGASNRLLLGSGGSVVFGGARLVALVDVPGVVVVDTPDALLVVSRASSEKMKSVVEQVAAAGRADLL